MAAIVSKVPELVAEKFGGEDKVNLKQIQKETGLNYSTVSSWVKGRPERADFSILVVWCKYLDVQVGDILVYERDA